MRSIFARLSRQNIRRLAVPAHQAPDHQASAIPAHLKPGHQCRRCILMKKWFFLILASLFLSILVFPANPIQAESVVTVNTVTLPNSNLRTFVTVQSSGVTATDATLDLTLRMGQPSSRARSRSSTAWPMAPVRMPSVMTKPNTARGRERFASGWALAPAR